MSARYTGGLVYNAPGGWSGFFNGSSQYLDCGDQTAYEFGSGAFTIEAWVYLTSFASTCTIASKYVGGNVGASEFVFWVTTSGVLAIALDGGGGEDYIASASGAIALNNWYHVAVCKSGSTVYLFANGALLTSGTSSRTLNSTSTSLTLGGITTGSSLTGYISNLRILKGTALYTAAFTPPSGALAAITNTSLLTCAYPTFRDGSTNAFTLTATGATVNTLNPFPTSQLPNPALGGAGNGVYTMSQYAALKAANLWPAYDPYYRNVTLNLHGNGTNAAQNNTFLDSSTNNFTITRNGNTTQGTWSPYTANGYWSNYFDGSSGNISIPYNANYVFGTSDFTVECWAMFNDVSTSGRPMIALGYGANGSGPVTSTWALRYFGSEGSNQLAFYRYDGSTETYYTTSGFAPVNGIWYHIAVSRTGGNLRIFVNGVALYSAANSFNYTAINTSDPFLVALGYYGPQAGMGGPRYFSGYFSNIRVINGTGIYSANFTPPTLPLTAVTNTKLLICQSNRYVDNSTVGATLTPGGTTSVQRYIPFTPTIYYQPSVIGGSGYFDGSGDYLQAASDAAFGYGTGDFSLEFWAYPSTSSDNNRAIFHTDDNFNLELINSGGSLLQFFSGSARTSSPYTYSVNAWNHCAITRQSGTARMFINGRLVNNFAFTSSKGNSAVQFGANAGASQFFNGYLSNIRIVKGGIPSAYVTSSTTNGTQIFTPSTTPFTTSDSLTAGSVSLLLNYTNSAILDSAMMSDLETLGNAQISTSVVKYGTGAIALDGTGDYLNCRSPANVVYQFGTGDFTVEFWAYLTNSGNDNGPIFDTRSTSGNGLLIRQGNGAQGISNRIDAVVGGSVTASSGTISFNAWIHVAVVRSSGTLKVYYNGIGGTGVSATGSITGTNAYIGAFFDGLSVNIAGYFDDFRVTRAARYTANFTPPTSQVQDQ